MKKRRISLLILFFVIILCPTLVYSIITLSEPQEIYNLGDILTIQATVTGKTEGTFEVYLSCNNKEILYAEYLILKESKTKKFQEIIMRLKDNFGNCYLEANLNNETITSNIFKISNLLIFNLKLNSNTFIPGQKLEFEGTVKKLNENLVEGGADIFIDTNFIKNITIKKGIIDESIIIPKEISTYTSNFIIKAKDNENLNYGEYSQRINFPPVATILEMNINSPAPGEFLTVTTTLYDQSKIKINEEEVLLLIYDPKNKIFHEETIKSGETKEIKIPENAQIGTWKVSSKYKDILSEKDLEINENIKISTNINGNILSIKNIGNKIYEKESILEIESDKENFIETISLNLNIGKEERLKMQAPDGEYSIILDGEYPGKTNLSGKSFLISEISLT
jgi:hypothetical protein